MKMFSKVLSEEPCSPGVVQHNTTTKYFGNFLDAKFNAGKAPHSMEYLDDNHNNLVNFRNCNTNNTSESVEENLKNTPCPMSNTKGWHDQPLEIQFSHIYSASTRKNVMLFIKELMDVKTNLSIGIIGKNKIQLMKLIIRLSIGNQIKVGLLTESIVNGLNLRQSPIEYLSSRFENDLNLLNLEHPVDRAKYIRRQLRRVSLKGKLVYKRMKHLTPTQLYRVALCVSTWNEPRLLIMNGTINEFSLDVIDRFRGHIFLIPSQRCEHLLDGRIDEYWSSN